MCSRSIPVLNLSAFLAIGPYLNRLVLHRSEAHRLTACGSACMASVAAVVDSLSIFKFEAVTSFRCVHPDKRIGPPSPNWSLYSAL